VGSTLGQSGALAGKALSLAQRLRVVVAVLCDARDVEPEALGAQPPEHLLQRVLLVESGLLDVVAARLAERLERLARPVVDRVVVRLVAEELLAVRLVVEFLLDRGELAQRVGLVLPRLAAQPVARNRRLGGRAVVLAD